MPAGEIADRVGISATNTSFHLKELDRAGLLRATRQGRFIRYAIDVDGMRELLTYLRRIAARAGRSSAGAFVAASKVCRPKRRQPSNERPALQRRCSSARTILPDPIIAECVMNRLGAGKFKAYSAGSQPSGKIHPFALELLQRLNYDTTGCGPSRGKSLLDLVLRGSISCSRSVTMRPTRFARSGRASR